MVSCIGTQTTRITTRDIGVQYESEPIVSDSTDAVAEVREQDVEVMYEISDDSDFENVDDASLYEDDSSTSDM